MSKRNLTQPNELESKKQKCYEMNIKEIYKNNKYKWIINIDQSENSIEIEKPLSNFKEKYIEILRKISPIILLNSIFKNSELLIKEDKITILTDTNKLLDITNILDKKNIGIEIIKKLSFLNIGDGSICPITLENPFELVKKGIKISCIKGEPSAYVHDNLVKICNDTGISPLTRKKFTIDDIVDYEHTSSLELPIESIIPTKVTVKFNKDKIEPLNITCLIDISGSMNNGYGKNVAYHPLLMYIKNLPNLSRVKLYTFSLKVKKCFDFKDKDDINSNFLDECLTPYGPTAFYESLISVIEQWEDVEGKNLLLVITDGSDTCDQEDKFKNKLSNHTKTCWDKINCYFMHPNNVNGPDLLNLSKDQCLIFDNDQEHTSNAISGLSQLTQNYSLNESNQLPSIPDLLRASSSQRV